MKAISYIFLGFITIVTSISCDEDYSYPQGIQGVWIWEKSVGGWGTSTPENSGQQRVLKITPLFYREFINGSLVWEAQYEIVPEDDRFYNSPQVLKLTPGNDYILTYSKSSLILDESYNDDAPIHYYKRP